MLKWYPNLWSLTFSRHLEKSRLETFSQRVCVVFPIQRMCRHSHLYLSMNAFWLASQSAAGTWTHRPPPGVSWVETRGWMAARGNKRFDDTQVVEWLMVVGFKIRRLVCWNGFEDFIYVLCLPHMSVLKAFSPLSSIPAFSPIGKYIRYSMVPN